MNRLEPKSAPPYVIRQLAQELAAIARQVPACSRGVAGSPGVFPLRPAHLFPAMKVDVILFFRMTAAPDYYGLTSRLLR